CISCFDEGYNCEWSQELSLDESFNEYLNAFVLIHILKDKLGYGEKDKAGFIFNMSAGYNLAGIKSPAVQRFFDRCHFCEKELALKINEAAAIYPRVRKLNIPPQISNSLTVSTMHGCPPDEVEKIGAYFISNRKFHTTIKLNPTLLGPDSLRRILNEDLGYQITVPDLAFDHDLKYPEAVGLIEKLSQLAQENKVEFSLKLTNTLETQNQTNYLPDSEPMVYMSGRALHPISVNLAAKLQQQFLGLLDISFSAGADYENIGLLVACGLSPITVCTDPLRPGGYGRISQYLETLKAEMKSVGALSISDFITAKAGGHDKLTPAALENLKTYAAKTLNAPRYKRKFHMYKNGVKSQRPLTPFNCAQAPCVAACPASQNIPRYLHYVALGEIDKAYETIMATNPFPHMQGAVCDHLCQFKCTRLNYDSPLKIREIKRFVAENHKNPVPLKPRPTNGFSVAIVGAGPSGLSAAHYLAWQGFTINIFEAKPFPGGMASDAIPSFRLNPQSLKTDIDNILALGAKITFNHKIDNQRFNKLCTDYDYVYIAVGAQVPSPLTIEGKDALGLINQLGFLSQVRRGQAPAIGPTVLVLGAGNSAFDAARTARRLGCETSIVYRRSLLEMPASPEEISEAINEGVNIIELAGLESILVKDGRVACARLSKMKLGSLDESGRARFEKIPNSQYDVVADTIITAIGQQIDLDFLPPMPLKINPQTGLSQIPNVYVGGDAKNGPDSLITAIAHGRHAAQAISEAANQGPLTLHLPKDERKLDEASLQYAQARRGEGPKVSFKKPKERLDFELYSKTFTLDEAQKEAARCLSCDLLCNVCVTVCPNRANLAIEGQNLSYPIEMAHQNGHEVKIEFSDTAFVNQAYQIVNLADFCNECGNCTTFCPTGGAPYKDKFRLHLSQVSFENASDGVYFAQNNLMEIKFNAEKALLKVAPHMIIYEDSNMKVELNRKTLAAQKVNLKQGLTKATVTKAAQMAVLWLLLEKHHLLQF
ncbi:MAG: FAD-dependent oxidoreductase, partial [Candidatus Adiutrix sp.]